MRALRQTTLPLLILTLTAVAIGSVGCPGGGGSGSAIISAIDPPEGTSAGGAVVRVLGTNFGNGPASVLFGGVPCTNVVVVSDSQISCLTPPHEIPGLDTFAVDVEVRSSGNKAFASHGYQYVNDHELEAPNSHGRNDTFLTNKRVPLDADYTGYIGDPSDVDILHLHTPSNGRVLIDVTWNASYTSAGLAGIQVEFFHGPEPTVNPESYYGGQTIAVGTNPADAVPPKIENWLRMSYVNDGHGPYLRVRGIGGALHAGYDPEHAYTVRAEFIADPTFEPFAADDFHTARVLTTGLQMIEATYDQDFDWYRVRPTKTSSLRVKLDALTLGTLNSNDELSLAAKLFFQPSDIDVNRLEDVDGADIAVVDRPSPYGAVFEAATLMSNHNYFLRLSNTNFPGGPTAAFDYPVSIQLANGLFEDAEPGALLPAETEFTANIVNPTIAVPMNVTGYMFHEGDNDWFKIVTPAAASTLTLTWDHTSVRTDLGDYDTTANPFGGDFGMMVFDETWFLDPQHVVAPAQAMDYDYVPGSDTHSLGVTVAPSSNYYLLLDGVHGYDTQSSWAVTITAN